MLKIEASDIVILDGQPVESRKEIILHYSVKSVLLYEQHTGGKFFNDYSSALQALDISKLMAISEDSVSQDEEIAIGLAMISNADVNNFLMSAIPALYAKIIDGKFVQNDSTYAEALDSEWLISLINPTTLAQLIEEMSKGATMQDHNQPTNKKKNM